MRHLLKTLEMEVQIDFGAEALLVGMDMSDVPWWQLGVDTSKVAKVPFVLLPAAFSRCLKITQVICPLACAGLDAMDVATYLQDAEFDGEFIVFAPHLPRPEIVRFEILNDAPDINLKLIASVVH